MVMTVRTDDRGILDFRSDTVTKPTAAMMAAIAHAELGDAGRGDDPTVNRLEEVSARVTGKDEALFLPSGTMGNLVAVLSHVAAGEEIIVEAGAHIYNSELASFAAVAGVMARPLAGDDGVLDPIKVKAAIKRVGNGGVASTGLLCVENSHNSAGGTVTSVERMAALYQVAKVAGIPVHLDGARLFNAAAFLGCSAADICRYADSVMFCVSKGLSAPIGSLLAGDKAFIARARRKARMLGGVMRQAGVIAAAGLVALEDPLPGLRRDHRLARLLAEGLAGIDPHLVRLETVQTNIVNCYLDHFPAGLPTFSAALKDRGILVNQTGAKARFVLHRHLDEAAVEACLASVAATIKPSGGSA
jgi:threonine aldolase